MTHFGIICPAGNGHLNPMTALGRELQRRGHRVTLFQIPDIESKVKTARLEFQAIGAAFYPPGKADGTAVDLCCFRNLAKPQTRNFSEYG